MLLYKHNANIGEKTMTREINASGDRVSITVDTVADVKVARLRNFIIDGKDVEGKVDVDEYGNLSLFGSFTTIDVNQMRDIVYLAKLAANRLGLED